MKIIIPLKFQEYSQIVVQDITGKKEIIERQWEARFDLWGKYYADDVHYNYVNLDKDEQNREVVKAAIETEMARYCDLKNVEIGTIGSEQGIVVVRLGWEESPFFQLANASDAIQVVIDSSELVL
jgi:hypothetical protein